MPLVRIHHDDNYLIHHGFAGYVLYLERSRIDRSNYGIGQTNAGQIILAEHREGLMGAACASSNSIQKPKGITAHNPSCMSTRTRFNIVMDTGTFQRIRFQINVILKSVHGFELNVAIKLVQQQT
jgi:hypothetical protein